MNNTQQSLVLIIHTIEETAAFDRCDRSIFSNAYRIFALEKKYWIYSLSIVFFLRFFSLPRSSSSYSICLVSYSTYTQREEVDLPSDDYFFSSSYFFIVYKKNERRIFPLYFYMVTSRTYHHYNILFVQ